jgi:hypothetical protein
MMELTQSPVPPLDVACGSMVLHDQVFSVFALVERKNRKEEKRSTALPKAKR